jgi:HTH-type transcriptional regulator, sugar sensing transcriptional regulator
MDMTADILAPKMLTQLGFSETEALIYCELLRNPGATGYGVAKAIRKAQANVYTALSCLSEKGAVIMDRSDVRAYRAVPASELLPRLSREFQEKCAAAEFALSTLETDSADDHFYQLTNAAQVYERARRMCEGAQDSLAVALFPKPFARLKDALEAAIGRGVGVSGITFKAADLLPGATLVTAVKAARDSSWARASMWPRDQLTLIADGEEALVALFDRETDTVITAVYTTSTYLACILHSGVVDATILNKENPEALQVSLNKRLFGKIPRGFVRLVQMLGPTKDS